MYVGVHWEATQKQCERCMSVRAYVEIAAFIFVDRFAEFAFAFCALICVLGVWEYSFRKKRGWRIGEAFVKEESLAENKDADMAFFTFPLFHLGIWGCCPSFPEKKIIQITLEILLEKTLCEDAESADFASF